VSAEHLIGADLRTSAIRNARSLVKVPPIGAACSPLATAGRFIFTPALWQALDDSALSGSAALPAAVRALMERERVFACLVEGRRFDCGSKLGFLEAQFAFAQKRGELWSGLRQSLGDMLARADAPPPAAAAMLTASVALAPTDPARAAAAPAEPARDS
jgi:UTP--glucose-1-phosphate uridylyltransferase